MKRILLALALVFGLSALTCAADPPAARATLPPAYGTVKSLADNRLVMTDVMGNNWTFLLGDGCNVQIIEQGGDRAGNGDKDTFQKGSLSDLKAGMTVHVAYNRNGDDLQASLIRQGRQSKQKTER